MLGFSFMSQGFQQVQRGKRETGKWKHVDHPGAESVARETYRGWQIEVANRRIGVTVRRQQYSATVRQDRQAPKYLGSFSSKSSALSAARHHIDLHYRNAADPKPLKGPHRR